MIEDLTAAYLKSVDDAVPGFVDKLYVVGSAALGAWQPGVSDIDTVIFPSRVPAEADLAALRDVHAAMPAKPHFDGVYLASTDEWPDDRRVAPFVVNGEFHTDRACGELTPVVWLTLQRYGIPVRGPAVGELGVRVDLHALRAYNLDNLRTYWQASAAEIYPYVADLEPSAEMDAETVTWVVLGPARLHYTLANTDITSKSGAGKYAASLFPAYASLAERAIRWRAGAPEVFTAADLRASAELTDAVANDAWKRWG
jgi:hypothetical protein